MNAPELKVALKEWASVCQAMVSGQQMILLRKGGIHEVEGVFQLEEREFLLFPTYLHQNAEMLKPDFRGMLESHTTEPEVVPISAAAVVTDILRIERRSQIDAIYDQHIWGKAQIDMRFNYKPQNPLYLILLRAYVLGQVTNVKNTAAYAGCKSWVPLDVAISMEGAKAALDDANYESRRRSILERIGRS